MKIETIRINNYKVFRRAEIENAADMSVFLGANGSGKTTLFDIFGFLNDALKENVKRAFDKRGGFHEVISRDQTGNIRFEIEFRSDKIGERAPWITYRLETGLKDNSPIVINEILSCRIGRTGEEKELLAFSRGKGFAVLNEEEYLEGRAEAKKETQVLDSPDTLAVKGLGQFKTFKTVSAFRKYLENWFLSDFNIDAARDISAAGTGEHLSPRGDNLPAVARFMYHRHPDIFERILDKMKQRVPGISKIEARETEDGRIVLRFQDGSFKDPFIARHVSDGTIKLFGYLVLLNAPRSHPLLCIEEPENYLHPELLFELVEEFRRYARNGGQVFISTHSPEFINALNIDELFWLTREKGYSTVKRADRDKTVKSLVEAGDLLGSLWKQNYLKGSGPTG